MSRSHDTASPGRRRCQQLGATPPGVQQASLGGRWQSQPSGTQGLHGLDPTHKESVRLTHLTHPTREPWDLSY